MADQYGKLELPAVNATPQGDPALAIIGAFCQAVLNAECQTAWELLDPRSADPKYAPGGAVRAVRYHDPQHGFIPQTLPALFIHRERGESVRVAEDWETEVGEIKLHWVLAPVGENARHLERMPFGNAIKKALEKAFDRLRHPAYEDATDTDPDAKTIAADPDSIKTSFATSTSTQSYSGAALDGAIGAGAMSPRLALTVTTEPAPGQYNTADPIVATYTDWLGNTDATVELQLTDEDGGETISTTVEGAAANQYDFPAQPGTGGTFQLGTAARAGEGSFLLERAGLLSLRLRDWQPADVRVRLENSDGSSAGEERYLAFVATLLVRERLDLDLDNFAVLDGADVSLVREDGSIITSVEL